MIEVSSRIISQTRPVIITMILLVLFAVILWPGSATAGPRPPRPKIQTATDAAIRKLSPDLRKLDWSQTRPPVLISVLMTKGTAVQSLLKRAAIAKPIGAVQWATGEIDPASLAKLASIPGVISVISTQTFQPVDAPGEKDLKWWHPPRLTGVEFSPLLRQGGKNALLQKLEQVQRQRRSARRPHSSTAPGRNATPTTVKVADIHGATAAYAKGFSGNGVMAAIVDTGVDFGHPDLQGTQARIPSGPYAGWPFAYNTLSGYFFAIDPTLTVGPDTYWDLAYYWFMPTWYAHTLPVTGATCNTLTCTATLEIDFGTDAGWPWSPIALPFTWPDTSQSHTYYYTVHPDLNHLIAGYILNLGYAASPIIAPAAVILSDPTTAGVYDTAYVDVDFDQDLTDEHPMRKGNELAGADLFDAAGDPGADGVWDLSAGMLTWIADGANPPPGVGALYDGVTIPEAGRLISFLGDEDSHGTNVASDIVAQSVITDPAWVGPINPLFTGAVQAGGVGGPVLAGMAPQAKVAAFQNGFWLPFDAWALAAIGFDGLPNTGDEAQIVSNSWGSSETINDGWDTTSRFAHYLNRNFAPNTVFLAAVGNGGHGYGTTSEPDGGSIIDVGASTAYGSLAVFELVRPDQFTWGDVQPWSNRGPTMLGDVSPDVVAVGAWGTGANPLNIYFGNGQAAYDVFGGTSMSAPIAAGNLALVYQAFKQKFTRWPTWQEARDIFFNGAHDLGYDALTQGSGNVDANRATDIAAGTNAGYWVEPAQWSAGGYRGTEYPAFPAILHPGDSATKTFTIHNPTAGGLTVNLASTTLTRVGEQFFTLAFPSFPPSEFTTPSWITDITPLLTTYDPDLVQAQVIFPYNHFDVDGNYHFNNLWNVLFYDWTDLNGDGNLWTDDNGNQWVDEGEIDEVPDPAIGEDVYEYNRFTYGYPSGTYLEARVGRDSLTRKHAGVYLGLQRAYGNAAINLQVRLTFFKKTTWPWLSLASGSVPVLAEGSVPFNATVTVPPGTAPGLYQGALEASHGPHRHTIPVMVHVAANSASFDFGAASPSEPMGDTPYDNGHLFGGFDWSWRYESGDWRLFYFDVPPGTAGPGKKMLVDTRWQTTPTDVDTWVYGATPDEFSTTDPFFFGPSSVQPVGGSNDTWIGGGKFLFDTLTGEPRELVAADIRDGLGFIALHNVLYAGTQFGEPLVGTTSQVEVNPPAVALTAVRKAGSWTETFITGHAIAEGLQVQAFGLSQPLVFTGQLAKQDNPHDFCTAS